MRSSRHPSIGRAIAFLLGLTAAGCGVSPSTGLFDADVALYALVTTIDGVSFGPPLGPTIEATGPFDASLLGDLRVVLERVDERGQVETLATFDQRSTPALTLLGPHELYWMNVPAAAYFTDPSKAYRFRVLLGAAEVGRSDMSSKIFEVMSYVPTLPVGVKLRLERRAAPALAAIAPASVLAGAADLTLTLDGAGFTNDCAARFGGHDLPTTKVSSTRLTAVVPATLLAAAGTSEVTVFVPAPGGGASAAVGFDVQNAAPALTALTPSAVLAGAGDTLVTLDGASFVAGASVAAGGLVLPSTLISSTRLVTSLPASLLASAGGVSISVANPSPAAGASGALTFVVNNPAPSISTLTPASATAGVAATTVTIDGSSFVRGASAAIGGTALATTFVSSTRLTAVIPAGSLAAAGVLSIVVSNPAPALGSSGALSFTVNHGAPSLTTLSPGIITAGSAAFTLTINGAGFVSGAVARFNGTTLATTFVSSTRVTAAVSAALVATVGTYNVTVTNPAPTTGASAALSFVVNTNAAVLTSLSPAAATTGSSAFTLTLTGSSFVSGAYATFNGTNLTTTFVSSTQLTAAVPATLVATAGTYAVTATNPAPGGGTSGSINFVVSGATDPYFANVVLLMHMDGADGATTFPDVRGHSVSASGGAHVQASGARFGTGAAAFNGAGAQLLVNPTGSELVFTTPFTIEAWVNGTGIIFSEDVYCTATLIDAGRSLHVWVAGVTVWDYYGTAIGTFPAGWHHFAHTFDGATYRWFRDGVLLYSVAGSGYFQTNNYFVLGGYSNGVQPWFNGLIDEVRVTRGVARYTSSFTPPTGAFPDR